MSRRQFGPDGCLVRVGDRTCGEKESLQIIQQFKRLYESKLQQIEDDAGGGDCLPGLQAKVSLQREWIRDLTQQNELLVRAVEELEQEASNRVAMLEQKLEMSVRKGSEVMQKYRDFGFSNKLNEPSHKVEPALHSDSRKLESMQHSDSQRLEPMRPSDSQRRELMQHSDSHRLESMPHRDSQKSGSMAQYDTGELEPTLRSDSQRFEPMLHNDSQGLDMMLHSDSQRLGSMSHRDSHRGSRKSEPMVRSDARKLVEMLRSDVRSLIEFIRRVRDEGSWSVCGLHFYTVCADSLLGNCKPGECPCVEDEGLQNKIKTVEELEAKRQMLENMEDKLKGMPSQEDVDNIAAKLQATEEELIAVKRSTMDMRNALTIEVADKHDIILNLRRDVQQLEEQCRQSNKQTQFKDDIIKELRKEIKQLKAEGYEEKLIAFSDKNADLQENFSELKSEFSSLKQVVTKLVSRSELFEPEAHNTLQQLERVESKISNLSSSSEPKRAHDIPQYFERVKSKTPSLSFSSEPKSAHDTPQHFERVKSKAPNLSSGAECKSAHDTPQHFERVKSKTPNLSSSSERTSAHDTPQHFERVKSKAPNVPPICKPKSAHDILQLFESVKSKTSNLSSNFEPKSANDTSQKFERVNIKTPNLSSSCEPNSIDDTSRQLVRVETTNLSSDSETKSVMDEPSTTTSRNVGHTSTGSLIDSNTFDRTCQTSISLPPNSEGDRANKTSITLKMFEPPISQSTPRSHRSEGSKLPRRIRLEVVTNELENEQDTPSGQKYNEVAKYCTPSHQKHQQKTACHSKAKPGKCTCAAEKIPSFISKEVDNMTALANNDCRLFYNMAQEINKLLKDTHEKEKVLLNQQELIKVLSQKVIFLHRKLKELEILSARHNSVSTDEDCAALRLRLAQAEAEIKTLKDAIFEANQELEKLYEQANEYLAERDDYKRKHNECASKISQLQADLQAAGEENERASKANAEAMQALKKNNESALSELQKARRDSEAMSQAQNETIEALQEAMKRKDQETKVVETPSGASWETMGIEEEAGSAVISATQSEKGVPLAESAQSVKAVPLTQSGSAATGSSKAIGAEQAAKQEALLCECNEYDETGNPILDESGDIICECMSLYNVEDGKVSQCHTAAHPGTAAEHGGAQHEPVSECGAAHHGKSEHVLAEVEISDYGLIQEGKMPDYGVEQGETSEYSDAQQRKMAEYSEGQLGKTSEPSIEQEKISEYSEGQLGKSSEYSEGQLGKSSEYSEGQLGKSSEYSEGQLGKISEYSEGQQTKISDYSEGQQAKSSERSIEQEKTSDYSEGQQAKMSDYGIAQMEIPEYGVGQLEGDEDVERALRRGSVGELQRTLERLVQQREAERASHSQEMANLKAAINELEKQTGGLEPELQGDMDLYQHSLNVLQASEERYKIEISQLRLTIANLQEALVASKQQLDQLQQKASGEINRYAHCIHNLHNIISATDHQCLQYYNETKKLGSLIQCMRDTNLELEVTNFGFVQDVAMLEARLLKYQSSFKSNEQCICALENELIQQQAQNTHLKQHLCALTCELTAMQRVINEAKQLHQRFLLLQEVHEDQLQETDAIRQELIRQAKLSEMDTARIEELQQLLCEKTCQLSQFEQEYYNIQQELETALGHNQELKNEVAQLIIHIKRYEQSCIENEERTDLCEQEIEECKCSLNEMKEKLVAISELLHQKIEQYNELESNYYVQSNALACLKQQLAGKESCEEDADDLRRTNEKLKCQICSLQTTMAMSQEHAQATCGKLSKCLEEMSNLRAQRLCLETRNEQFRTELQDLQSAYDDLSQSYSRVLKMMEAMKCKCCKTHTVNQQQPRGCYNPAESYASQTNNSTVTVSSTEEVYMYEETEEDYIEDDCGPCPILKRVENMTQEVQNSNKYWQSQLGDHDYMVTRDQ